MIIFTGLVQIYSLIGKFTRIDKKICFRGIINKSKPVFTAFTNPFLCVGRINTINSFSIIGLKEIMNAFIQPLKVI